MIKINELYYIYQIKRNVYVCNFKPNRLQNIDPFMTKIKKKIYIKYQFD